LGGQDAAQDTAEELTALPRHPSWWGGGLLPLLKNLTPLRPLRFRLRHLGPCYNPSSIITLTFTYPPTPLNAAMIVLRAPRRSYAKRRLSQLAQVAGESADNLQD